MALMPWRQESSQLARRRWIARDVGVPTRCPASSEKMKRYCLPGDGNNFDDAGARGGWEEKERWVRGEGEVGNAEYEKPQSGLIFVNT